MLKVPSGKSNPRHALFILNPASGSPMQDRRQIIRDSARRLGWQGDIKLTTPKTGADIIAARAIKRGMTHLIACGGDGTVRQVLSAAAGKDVAVGVVPLGTGNIFAKRLSIPLTIEEAVKVALLGKNERIDIGDANGNYFVLIAGMGLDVKAMSASQPAKNSWGKLAYLREIFGNISKRPETYKLRIDHSPERLVRAKCVLVANIGTSEAGINAVPGAGPQNGVLKIGIIKAVGLKDWFGMVTTALTESINRNPHYDLLKGRRVEIVPLNGPRKFECDGDNFPATEKLVITIYPRAVTVLVP